MVQAAGVRTYPEGLEACGSAACSLGGVAGPSYSRHCARPLAHRPCRRAVGRALRELQALDRAVWSAN